MCRGAGGGVGGGGVSLLGRMLCWEGWMFLGAYGTYQKGCRDGKGMGNVRCGRKLTGRGRRWEGREMGKERGGRVGVDSEGVRREG